MPIKKIVSILVILLILLLLLAGGYFFMKQRGENAAQPAETALSENLEDGTLGSNVDSDVAAASAETFQNNAEKALSERILGNPNAPVKISEHSSFTCGHCGAFHREVFAEFKREWIDSGKAYLVFSDFPLNAPALHASIIARCLPEDQYFDFVDMLFATQDDWAYNVGYLDYLKTEAAKRGLSNDDFTTCLQNEDIQKGILDRVRATQAQWEINSTPSFVINNEATLTGAASYADFNAALEAALNPAPVATPDAVPDSPEATPSETEAAPAEEEEITPVVDPAPVVIESEMPEASIPDDGAIDASAQPVVETIEGIEEAIVETPEEVEDIIIETPEAEGAVTPAE